ncbi:uncharacterized protein LOC144119896 [Amblyomma americanum]
MATPLPAVTMTVPSTSPTYLTLQTPRTPKPFHGRAEGRISLDIPVLVDTKKVSALVDTGADYSILSGRLATTLKKVTTPWKGPDIRTAGGHVVAPLGMCTARVTVRGCTFVATFLVLRECSRDVILGIDFLREHGAIIDLPNRLVTFSTKLATAEPAHQGSQSALRVAEDNVTVPPRASILARVTCDEPHRGLRVVEPNVSLVLTKGIAVARGLSCLHDGWTEVLITNFCNEHRHLFRGTVIAYVDHVQEVAECFACEEDTTGGDAEALDDVNVNPGLSSAEKRQLQDLLREFPPPPPPTHPRLKTSAIQKQHNEPPTPTPALIIIIISMTVVSPGRPQEVAADSE